MSGAICWVEHRPDGVIDFVRRPTAAEIAAWLQARPDLAVEVVGLLRVAGPWEGNESWNERNSVDGLQLATIEHNQRSIQYVLAVGDRVERYPTLGEARAAADAALVAAGWALASGGGR